MLLNSSQSWPFAGSFGLNTDILATNLINLTVVVGVLIFFWKGSVCELSISRIDWIYPAVVSLFVFALLVTNFNFIKKN